MTSGRGIPGSQEVVAAGGSAPTRLGGRRQAAAPGPTAGDGVGGGITERLSLAGPHGGSRARPTPLSASPFPDSHALTPTLPPPPTRPSVAGHRTGSSGVQDGDYPPRAHKYTHTHTHMHTYTNAHKHARTRADTRTHTCTHALGSPSGVRAPPPASRSRPRPWLKIARPDYIWFCRIPARPRAPRPSPPRPAPPRPTRL